MILIKSIFRRKFESQSIDDGILKGVIVCEKGEAKGHGFYLNDTFLDDIVKLTKGIAIKVRCDHPEDGKSGKLLSIVGEASNFHRDGDKVRADIKLFDVPASEIISKLAKQASDLFGMSIDFVGKMGKKLKSGLQEIACTEINAVDFVESPAAASSLFHKQVDSQNIHMTVNLSKEVLTKLGLSLESEEGEIIEAIKNLTLTKMPKKLSDKLEADKKSKLFDMGAHRESLAEFAKFLSENKADEGTINAFNKLFESVPEKKDDDEDDKKEKLDDKDEDDKKDKKEDKMSEEIKSEIQRLAALEVTKIIAQLGVKKTSASLPEEGEKKVEDKLSPEEVVIADKLGVKHEDYLKQLNKYNVRLSK